MLHYSAQAAIVLWGAILVPSRQIGHDLDTVVLVSTLGVPTPDLQLTNTWDDVVQLHHLQAALVVAGSIADLLVTLIPQVRPFGEKGNPTQDRTRGVEREYSRCSQAQTGP